MSASPNGGGVDGIDYYDSPNIGYFRRDAGDVLIQATFKKYDGTIQIVLDSYIQYRYNEYWIYDSADSQWYNEYDGPVYVYTNGTIEVPNFTSPRTGYTSTWSGGYTVATPVVFSSSFTVTQITTPLTYTVSFNANGGSSTPGNGTATYDSSYTLPAAISRIGYTFSGWKTGTDPNRIASFIFTHWTYTASTAFTAQWTLTPYTLIWNRNGAGGTTRTDTNINYNSLNAAPTPKAVGYTFKGWYDTETGGNLKVGAGSNYTMPNNNVTLYAQWTNNISIKFSDLRSTFNSSAPDPIKISTYFTTLGYQTNASRTISTDFKGKGPVI